MVVQQIQFESMRLPGTSSPAPAASMVPGEASQSKRGGRVYWAAYQTGESNRKETGKLSENWHCVGIQGTCTRI